MRPEEELGASGIKRRGDATGGETESTFSDLIPSVPDQKT